MSTYLELVESSFTQEHFDKQTSQKPYVAYSIKDGNVIYNIVPNEEGTMYTIYRVVKKDISNCTYNMVDLGLSVKWADRNVGAKNPEHYGSYFQWGEIVRDKDGKPTSNAYTFDGAGEITAAELAEILNPMLGPQVGMEITADNVGDILEMMGITGTDLTNTPVGALGLSLDKVFNWDSYFDITDDGGTLNKYYNNGGLTVLESIDDAVTVHMGIQYRIPTMDEINELINNTTQTFIDVDGNEYIKGTDTINIEEGKLKGVRFISSNGNSIFIPAAGSCGDSQLSNVGIDGSVWSSSLGDGYGNDAWHLYFTYDGNIHESSLYRIYGYPVRGVQV